MKFPTGVPVTVIDAREALTLPLPEQILNRPIVFLFHHQAALILELDNGIIVQVGPLDTAVPRPGQDRYRMGVSFSQLDPEAIAREQPARKELKAAISAKSSQAENIVREAVIGQTIQRMRTLPPSPREADNGPMIDLDTFSILLNRLGLYTKEKEPPEATQ